MIEKIVANGHGSLNPKYLAVHSTANPGASAYNHTLLWSREPKYAVHAVSDWKEAYHTVPWDRLCYQVGNGNSTCIGIEICEATNQADFMRGLEIAREAIWEMLNMKGWNVDDHVRSHLWFTENYGGSDHTDPIPYLKKWGWTWNDFINFLKEGDEMVDVNEIARAVWDYGIGYDGQAGVDDAPAWMRLGWNNKNIDDIKSEVFRTDDPSGRNKEMKDHDHIKWMAARLDEQDAKIDKILELLDNK